MTWRRILIEIQAFVKILWWQGVRAVVPASVLDPVDRDVEAKPEQIQCNIS